MATVSLSPNPLPPSLSTMSNPTRRIPLSTNHNAANSPLRPTSTNSNNYAALKHKRSMAQIQREEQYGQPPPAKKQMLDATGAQRLLKSPSQQQPRVTKNQYVLQQKRNYNSSNSYENKVAKERSAHAQQQTQQHADSASTKITEKDIETIVNWQKHHRTRFPKMVFFFDHVPEDVRRKLAKDIASLGAREEKFFSIDITHVVTTRSIPQGDASASQREATDTHADKNADSHGNEQEQEQVQTINPSLLSRNSQPPQPAVKRKLFDAELRNRKLPVQNQDDSVRRPKKMTDVLVRARDMGKKVWTLEKLQRMLALLLEPDPYVSAALAYGPRTASAPVYESRQTEDRNLLRLLHNERVNGPSDRDPTVVARELHHFKGPYIYIYDMDEKQKPIMVREYEKVADKSAGQWPQFRTAAMGRCPFVEDCDVRESRPRPKPKPQLKKPVVEPRAVLQPPEVPRLKPVTGKRTLSEMENVMNAHGRKSSTASTELMNPPQAIQGKMEFSANAFTGRAATGRMLGGEPVASGVQPSNVTSAIRSQMISSTAATPGLITGLSKEVHGLQRQVLKRNTPHASQDPSSRRTLETSFRDESATRRSFTLGRTSSRVELAEKSGASKESAGSRPVSQAEKRVEKTKTKKDLKPGYCENCQEKYDDFDEHIDSKKHRRFADDPHNWADLDDLLSQLERVSKHKPYSTQVSTSPIYEEAEC